MLWQSLIEYAEKSHLVEVRIDLNLAAIQEAYHASWKRRTSRERRELWRTEVPLFIEDHVVGRITLCGERDAGALACDTVGRVMETLAMLEGEIAALGVESRTRIDRRRRGGPEAIGRRQTHRDHDFANRRGSNFQGGRLALVSPFDPEVEPRASRAGYVFPS